MQFKKHNFILLGILIALSLFYEYKDMIFYLPQSNASWRQADCASFALNYYQDGMHFFKPRVHNVISGEGNAVGECPILYYFIAVLYKIFGPHEVIFKLVNITIFFLGLLALFRMTYRITNDLFVSYLIPLIFFSIPMLMMYAISFLPDVASLSFALIGWDYILKYRNDRRIISFWLSMLFFVLAGWLKANSAISFIALGAMYFIECNNWAKWNNTTEMFQHKTKNIIGFALALLLIIGWYKWAIYYNESYHVSFLGTKAWPGWPIWELNPDNYASTIVSFYFYAESMINILSVALFFFLVPFVLLNRNYIEPFFAGIIVLLLTGILMFLAYFFLGMRDQVYYYVNLAILPVFIFITSLVIIKNKYGHVFHSKVFRAILVLFLLYNVYESKAALKVYYHGGKMHEKLNKNLYDPQFRAFIDKTGIEKKDKVISIPDITPDISLYLINRPGWTNFNHSEYAPAVIDNCISHGAKYLIVSDASVFSIPGIKSYTKECVGNYENIYVYRLPIIKSISINLKASNGKYIACEILSSGELNASREVAGDWETFSLFEKDNNKVAFRAYNGKYVSAEMDKQSQLVANRDSANAWEIFTKVQVSDSVIALKADNGKFVCSVPEKNGALMATSDKIGEREKFIVRKK